MQGYLGLRRADFIQHLYRFGTFMPSLLFQDSTDLVKHNKIATWEHVVQVLIVACNSESYLHSSFIYAMHRHNFPRQVMSVDPPTSAAESPHLQASPVGRRSLGTDPRSRRSSATGCCPWLHSADEMCLRCWENLRELQDFPTIFLIFL